MSEYKSVGLLGGTFNPIHIGHLLVAEYARAELGLDQVIFIPAARPPHKEGQSIPEGKVRLDMVNLAVAGNPTFSTSDVELVRPGPSYTIDTLNHFQGIYPHSAIYFIMGADSLLLINTWKDIELLSRAARLVVVTRPGYTLQVDDYISGLPQIFTDNLIFLQAPGIDLSSTDIRNRLKERKTIRYLLPEGVEQYIRTQGLYV